MIDFTLEEHDGFIVVRDDFLHGGTKRRVLEKILPQISEKELIYAATPYGYGQVALALACNDHNLRATIFCPKLEIQTNLYNQVRDAGARVIEVDVKKTFSAVIQQAKDYAADSDKRGFIDPEPRYATIC